MIPSPTPPPSPPTAFAGFLLLSFAGAFYFLDAVDIYMAPVIMRNDPQFNLLSIGGSFLFFFGAMFAFCG